MAVVDSAGDARPIDSTASTSPIRRQISRDAQSGGAGPACGNGALLALAHVVKIATWPVREDLLWWWAAAGMQSLMSAADEKLTG